MKGEAPMPTARQHDRALGSMVAWQTLGTNVAHGEGARGRSGATAQTLG